MITDDKKSIFGRVKFLVSFYLILPFFCHIFVYESSELFLMKHKTAHTPPSQLIFSVNPNDLESYQTDVGKLITELITK